MEGKKDGPQSARFTWRIENFSTLKTKQYSRIFCVDGNKWRVLIFPKGNKVDQLSIYLDVADSTTLPCGWSRFAQFSLSVVDQVHKTFTVTRGTRHHFNAREPDLGFTSFMPLSILNDPGSGYLLNNTCIVEAVVSIVDCVTHDVKEESDNAEEKAEACLYRIIKVARDEDLLEQIGRDIYFDLVDHNKVHSFRMQKQMTFKLFKEEVAKEFGIPVQFQRFWLWAKRLNHSYRPNRPLTLQEEAQSVGQLQEVSDKANNAELKLFLEVELGQDLLPVPPPVKTKESLLLFFKLYDPVKEELRYVGHLFLKGSGKPIEILPKLNELAGFAPDEEIDLYEEIKFRPVVMCESIDKNIPFCASLLENGDIICFQKSPQVERYEECRFPDVPSFLEYVHNRQEVELPRSRAMGSQSESPSIDDIDAYISELVSVVETDAPFDSTTKGSATASINPQPTFDEAKKFFIKVLSQDLSEIPDFTAESIPDLSKCCNLTSSQREELNNFKLEFLTLLETYKISKHSLKVVEEKMAEKQGTKNSLVEQVKINAFAFQTRREIHKDLVSKEAELQAELANISEKKRSAEKEIKQLHGKMVGLEQSRSSLLEEFSTLETEKKTVKSTLSSVQEKWTELRRVFMEPNN